MVEAVSFDDHVDSDGDGESAFTGVGVTQFSDALAASEVEFGSEDRYRELRDDGRYRTYQSDDGEQGADDVDPRHLYRAPTINEIRWYYREGPFGSTIVEKPVRDAFKNGFTVRNDRPGKVEPFLDEYVPKLIDAEIKARRDGFSVLFFQLRDSADVSEAPENVQEVTRYRVFTVDDFTDSLSPKTVAEHFDDLTWRQVTVLDDDGIAIVDDVRHPDDGKLLGYGRESDDGSGPIFIHADRTQHFSWRKHVDGPIDDEYVGRLQGDSILTPVIHSLKAAHKGVWGMGQTLFRYSTPLHVVETPDDYGEEEFDDVDSQMNALNAASSITMPPGTTMQTHDAASDFDPEPFYEAIMENICAGTVFTKSVLKGTQSGTVSGSETDIKGYFSEVVQIRNNRFEAKIDEAVRMVSSWNQSIIPTFSLGYTIDWEPIFKLDALDRTESMSRVVTAVTNGLSNYLLSPEDAQSVLESEWAEIDVDVDLDELTEEEKDDIDRIVVQKGKQYAEGRGPEEEIEGNPEVGQNTAEAPNQGPMDQNDPTSS